MKLCTALCTALMTCATPALARLDLARPALAAEGGPIYNQSTADGQADGSTFQSYLNSSHAEAAARDNPPSSSPPVFGDYNDTPSGGSYNGR